MKKSILAISYSSHTAINRKVYSQLSVSYEVAVVIPAAIRFGNKILNADPRAEGDPVLYPLPLKGSNPRIHRFTGLWRVFRISRPDYIYLENDPLSLLCLYCCVLSLLYRTKLLCFTNENLPLPWSKVFTGTSIRPKLALILKRSICVLVRPFVSVVFCINFDGKKLFEQLKFREVVWIPLGFDPAIFKPDSIVRQKIRDEYNANTFVMGYFGRIVPEKGMILMLEALSKLKHYPWKLFVDSFARYESPYIQEIKRFIETHAISDRVIFFHADHQEVAKFMNACDLVVVPSYTAFNFKEQYGRVVQEAVACGCMTIVSDSGFLPHFFNDPFFVFREKNIESLKDKIEEVMNLSPARRESLISGAQDHILKTFSISAQARIIDDSLRSLK